MHSTQFTGLQRDPVQRILDRWKGDATPEPAVSHVPGGFQGEGLEAVAGRASRQARWKRFPSVLTEARCCRRDAEDAEFERKQDGAVERFADVYLEVQQVPCTQLVLTAVCGCRWTCDDVKGDPVIPHPVPPGPFQVSSLLAAIDGGRVLNCTGECMQNRGLG